MKRLVVTFLLALAACVRPPQDHEREATPIAEPLRVGGDVSELIEISRVKPACPRNASAGVAILEAIITADGRVESVRVLRSHSPEGDAAAVAAVRQWRYKPAMYHGKPVGLYLTITVLLCA